MHIVRFQLIGMWAMLTGLLWTSSCNRATFSERERLAVVQSAMAGQEQELVSKRTGMPVELVNSIGMRLRLIPPGEFLMGSPEARKGLDYYELQHRVRITKPFYIGVYEVTQAEYERVMGQNPSNFKGKPELPAEGFIWDRTVEFCRRLSFLEAVRAAGRTYRLPTEAEWEYACRAGTTTKYCFGDDERLLKEYAWYRRNAGKRTHPVGVNKPNGWGLHDMHGNVYEWCSDSMDWDAGDYYGKSPLEDPPGPSKPDATGWRVIRGGAWDLPAGYCQSSTREAYPPDNIKYADYQDIGFRVLLVPADHSSKQGSEPEGGRR